MAAAAAAAIVPLAASANAPVFSLTPAEQHTAAFIDLGTTEGRKMFSTATKPLDEPYDGSKNGMNMFMHQVNTRADICGWTTTIMTIPAPTATNPNATLSLLHQGSSRCQCDETFPRKLPHQDTYDACPCKEGELYVQRSRKRTSNALSHSPTCRYRNDRFGGSHQRHPTHHAGKAARTQNRHRQIQRVCHGTMQRAHHARTTATRLQCATKSARSA